MSLSDMLRLADFQAQEPTPDSTLGWEVSSLPLGLTLWGTWRVLVVWLVCLFAWWFVAFEGFGNGNDQFRWRFAFGFSIGW